MTKNAIIRSIQNARLELKEVEDSPMLDGFHGRRREIMSFIHSMEQELKHGN